MRVRSGIKHKLVVACGIAGLLAVAAVAARPTASGELEVRIEIAGDQAVTLPATVVATQVAAGSGGEEQRESVAEAVEIPGHASLRLGSSVGWLVTVQAAGYWSPDKVVIPGQSGESVALTVHPLTTLSGTVELAEGGDLPSELSLRFQAVPGAKGAAGEIEGTAVCPIDKTEQWECQAPAGQLDLRLRAEGFISHYFWDVALTTQEKVELGKLVLRPGASVVGQVTTEDDTPIGKSSTATLIPRGAKTADPAATERARRLSTSVKVTERGFVHLAGVAPGSYRFTVEREGFATLVVEPVVVGENEETELPDPLILRRPLTATFTVSPELDLYGKSWELRLIEPGFLSREVGSGTTDAQGRWRQGGLVSGSYELMISDSRRSRVALETIDLQPQQTDFVFDLPLVVVRGQVRLGDEPLAAVVKFGGNGPVSVRMEADAEGAYEGWVPRQGEWDVDVRATRPKVFRRLRKVEVEVNPAKGFAEVDFSLPDTHLDVEVVEEDGRPVPGARVIVIPIPATEKISYEKTDAEGKVTLCGFEPGTYRLEANTSGEAGTRSSETAEVDLGESEPGAPVRLVMRSVVRLRGTVVSQTANVPGAFLSARSVGGAGLPGLLPPQTVSDAAGRFTLDLPGGVTETEITVLPPGFLLTRLQVPVDPSRELTIRVQQEGGGTLRLQLAQPLDDPYSGKPRPFVVQDGSVQLDLGTLGAWAAMNRVKQSESELVVPNLPPGSYSFCRSVRSPPRDGDPESSTFSRECVDGFLPAYGELMLSEPAMPD